MNFSLSQMQSGRPCIGSEIALARGEHKLVELLQNLAKLMRAEAIELTSRKHRSALPALFAAWYANGALPVLDDEGEGEPHTSRHPLDIGSRRRWTLIIRRGAHDAPFTPAERALAEIAADLFRAAFKLWRQVETKSQRLKAFETFMGTLDCGVLLINAHGRLVFSNEKAREILNDGAGLSVCGGRLTAGGFANTVRLQAALHYALQSAGPTHKVEPNAVISIDRKEGAPLLVAAFPVTPPSPAPSALIGLFILDPLTDLSCATDVACRAHGLTPTEIRLVRHLAKGASLSDACEQMRIKPQTGRTYLKQVFSKFGICRQVDLVRRVLSNALPIRFAAPLVP